MEDKKDIVCMKIRSGDFKYFNVKHRTIPQNFFAQIFDGEFDRHLLSPINGWVKYYEDMEIEELLCNVVEYKSLLTEKIEALNFLKAIRFVLCVQSGMTRFDAYLDVQHTSPFVSSYVDSPHPKKEKNKRALMSATASYTNKPIVVKVAQVMNAPIEYQFQGYKHQMIEVLRDIAVNGTSQRERVNAANSLLQHLNPPNQNISINVNTQKSFIEQAQDALKLLAKKKLEDINEGENVEEIVNVDIIDEAAKLISSKDEAAKLISSKDEAAKLSASKDETPKNETTKPYSEDELQKEMMQIISENKDKPEVISDDEDDA